MLGVLGSPSPRVHILTAEMLYSAPGYYTSTPVHYLRSMHVAVRSSYLCSKCLHVYIQNAYYTVSRALPSACKPYYKRPKELTSYFVVQKKRNRIKVSRGH